MIIWSVHYFLLFLLELRSQDFYIIKYGLSFFAGPLIINISSWESEHNDHHENPKESLGSYKESLLCEANFWLPSIAFTSQVSWCQFWCASVSRVCPCTGNHSWRLPDSDRLHGSISLKIILPFSTLCSILMFLWTNQIWPLYHLDVLVKELNECHMGLGRGRGQGQGLVDHNRLCTFFSMFHDIYGYLCTYSWLFTLGH